METKHGIMRLIDTGGSIIGGLAGLIAIGLVVFKGGALATTVESHETRLVNIEHGSISTLREHIAVDDEREAETRRQLTELRTAIITMADLRADVKVLTVKIDSITKALDARE